MNPEVIVVGAGPAGSSTAYYLARRGRRVLLLERGRFPRDKSCGDGLTLPAVRILEETGVLEHLPDAGRIKGARVFMRSRGHRDFLYPSSNVAPDFGLVVPRFQLDKLICQQAVAAGAELWEKALVAQLIRHEGGVVGVEVSREAGPQRLLAQVVVAADGAASRLAFQAGLAQNAAAKHGFAIRTYFTGIEGLEDLLEIYMPLTDPTDRYILPSYGWVFPTGSSSANIGVGIFERGHDVKVRKLMARFLSDLKNQDPRFRHMEDCGTWLGAPLNFGFVPERCVARGLLLVGDAAGMISPFTGEGISYALESGKLAAEAIDRNLRADGQTPDLTDYADMLEKRFAGYFEAGRRSARRYLLLWHVLESTFQSEKPLFALCRKAALFPEAIGENQASKLLDDVSRLIDRGGLRVREDLLAVGEILINTVRRDWPFLARFSAAGQGDPGIPFRPALLLLLAAALGNLTDPRITTAASAVELGYIASLAHLSVDDAEPQADPPGNGSRPANWGNMLSLIVGDFFLSKAYELSGQAGATITRVIAESLAVICEGYVRERQNAFCLDVEEGEYDEIAAQKIATLFELPCRLGAMLGGLPSREVEMLRAYGRNLGLAFQLADEILDVHGRASELGKVLRADLREGNYSKVLREAMRRPGAERLRQLVSDKNLTLQDTDLVLALVEASGAIEGCTLKARAYASEAQSILSRFAPCPAQRTLWRLADYALDRDVGEPANLTTLI